MTSSGAGEGARRFGAADDTSSPSPWRAREERSPTRRLPLTIEGELVAKSTGAVSAFTLGDRVFHQKFGNGNVTAIDGNKLTIAFDRAGEKRVVDSFVERV
jgi:DNA helicase-2/ATP-dependent DNA helicase PcrA